MIHTTLLRWHDFSKGTVLVSDLGKGFGNGDNWQVQGQEYACKVLSRIIIMQE